MRLTRCEYADIPEYGGNTCADLYDCCDCGLDDDDCGCPYCRRCNSCDYCREEY